MWFPGALLEPLFLLKMGHGASLLPLQLHPCITWSLPVVGMCLLSPPTERDMPSGIKPPGLHTCGAVYQIRAASLAWADHPMCLSDFPETNQCFSSKEKGARAHSRDSGDPPKRPRQMGRKATVVSCRTISVSLEFSFTQFL